MIEEQGLKVYVDAIYRVYSPPIDIQIGMTNALLDELLRRNNCIDWTFISAANPFGSRLNHLLNFRRHEMLREKVVHYRALEGEIVLSEESAQAEKGFLIVGISRSDAAKLAILFEQNVMVAGAVGKTAELVKLG